MNIQIFIFDRPFWIPRLISWSSIDIPEEDAATRDGIQ
jgi:hypothetical protein